MYYRLKQIDLDGTIHYTDGVQVDVLSGVDEKPLPTEFALSQNFPNPFNPSTMIEFAVGTESHVKLEVYNMLGQKVATLLDEVRHVGYHSVRFNGSTLASGVYLYRLQSRRLSPAVGEEAGEMSFLRKMLLLK